MSQHLNIEIKARCYDIPLLHKKLLAKGADFKGVDHQIDTYYRVPKGRLKLRQGNIEKTLIHYDRPNQAEPGASIVHLYHPQDDVALKSTLDSALEQLVVVEKWRRIYFISHIKFHLDKVAGLGEFVEIEVINKDDRFTQEGLLSHCEYYMEYLGIKKADLIDVSYSDLLMK